MHGITMRLRSHALRITHKHSGTSKGWDGMKKTILNSLRPECHWYHNSATAHHSTGSTISLYEKSTVGILNIEWDDDAGYLLARHRELHIMRSPLSHLLFFMDHCIRTRGLERRWDGWMDSGTRGKGGRECEYVRLGMGMGMWHGKGGNCLFK